MIINKCTNKHYTNNNFFYYFFDGEITIEKVFSYIDKTNKFHPSDLSEYSIENYFKFFSTLKQITPEHLKESAFPIYQQAKIEFINQALKKDGSIKYFESFFNYSLLFSNEKKTFIKSILVEMIKNRTIFSHTKSFYETLANKNFVNDLFELIKNNYNDFVFSKYNMNTTSFSSYQSLNLKDKIEGIFFEKQSEFFIQYKNELLSCQNSIDYTNFKNKYSALNNLFSLSELDAFICYKTPLFEQCFDLFKTIYNSRKYPYFYDHETFYNFIECLNKYYCLFDSKNFISLYIFTKSYNIEYADVLIKNIIKKIQGIDIISLLIQDFDLVKDYISSDFLMNINLSNDYNLHMEDIPLDIWCFLYSTNKLFTKRLLNNTKSKEGDAFFDYIEKIQAAFNTIDNLENF